MLPLIMDIIAVNALHPGHCLSSVYFRKCFIGFVTVVNDVERCLKSIVVLCQRKSEGIFCKSAVVLCSSLSNLF